MDKIEGTLIILTHGFAKDEADSTCIPLHQNLVLALKANYPALNIIILSLQYPYHKKEYKWFGVTVIPFSGRNKGGIPRLLLRRKVNAVLKKIKRENTITGLLSFWYTECALIAKRFADKNGLRHFCWLQGQDVKANNKYPALIAPRPEELIALSDFSQSEFEKNHRIKPKHIITPGINIKQFEPEIKAKDIDIIAVGSLIPLKQFEIVIATVAELKEQIPGIKAIIIGNGPEKQQLQMLIAENDLRSNIVLTGSLSNPETLAWMQRAKILLHPSSFEGFGVVILEALYAGCKVVSFCKPMKEEIANWQIAATKDEMKQKALAILENGSTVYNKVIFSTSDDVAKKIAALFSQP